MASSTPLSVHSPTLHPSPPHLVSALLGPILPRQANSPADIQPVEEFLPHGNNLIAKQVLPRKEVNKDLINAKIEEIYKSFATWLADNNKEFPSLDPQVDAFTLRYFEQVNQELRELGKVDTMQIFREKTLAHLDEVLDNRGLGMEGRM